MMGNSNTDTEVMKRHFSTWKVSALLLYAFKKVNEKSIKLPLDASYIAELGSKYDYLINESANPYY